MTPHLKKKGTIKPFHSGCHPNSKASMKMAVSIIKQSLPNLSGFPGGSDGEVSACNAGDLGSIPRLRRFPGEGNGNPPQHSCLENSMDGGVWWATLQSMGSQRVGHN